MRFSSQYSPLGHKTKSRRPKQERHQKMRPSRPANPSAVEIRKERPPRRQIRKLLICSASNAVSTDRRATPGAFQLNGLGPVLAHLRPIPNGEFRSGTHLGVWSGSRQEQLLELLQSNARRLMSPREWSYRSSSSARGRPYVLNRAALRLGGPHQ